MLIKQSLRYTTVALALTFAATGLPAIAQTVDTTQSLTIEEIIVTARKTEESIQEIPISLSVFGAKDIVDLGVFDASDVGKYTPNVLINRQAGSKDNFSYCIRGVCSGETSLAVEPTVGLYLDEIYIARSTGAALDIVDLERIEILRGPQGTLFGRNTIGGAINVSSQKPLGKFDFKQLVAVGNSDYLRSQTSVNTNEWNKLAFKFSHLYAEKGGDYESFHTGEELGQSEEAAYRIAARWTPDEDVTVDYSYDYSDKETNSNTDQISHVRAARLAGGAISQQANLIASDQRRSKLYTYNSDDDESTSDVRGHGLVVEWYFNDSLTIKSISSYRDWKGKANGTDFGTFLADGNTVIAPVFPSALSPVPSSVFLPAGTEVSLFSATRRSTQHQFTQEFQFVGDLFDERLYYNMGVYYFEESAKEINPQAFALTATSGWFSLAPNLLAAGFPAVALTGLCDPDGALAGLFTSLAPGVNVPTACLGKDMLLGSPDFRYSTDNESIAVYGQFTYSVTGELDVMIGLRYTEDEKEANLTTSLINDENDGSSWTNFSPSITLDYQINEEMSAYLSMTNGYRAGGYNARATTIDNFRSPVDEETLLTYELGFKSDLLKRSLRVNAAIFLSDYKDLQIAQFDAGSSGASSNIVNAGDSKIFGVEVDVTWLPIPGLLVMLNYGHLDTEYNDYMTSEVNPVTGLTQEGTIDVSSIVDDDPKNEGLLALEYQFEAADYGQLSVRVDTVFVDKRRYHTQLNLYDSADDYHLLNARITLAEIPAGKDGRLRVSAWGKNLENKEYREWGIDFGALGFTTNTYGELRSYGVDITYEYGD